MKTHDYWCEKMEFLLISMTKLHKITPNSTKGSISLIKLYTNLIMCCPNHRPLCRILLTLGQFLKITTVFQKSTFISVNSMTMNLK